MKKYLFLFFITISLISLTSCKKLKVSFLDENNQLIEEIKTKKGETIELINVPEEKQDIYIWDKTNEDLKNIKSDITVNRKYLEYNKICKYYIDEELILSTTVKYSAKVTAPEISEKYVNGNRVKYTIVF